MSCHAGEELLRHNGISYTVVRPGGLKNTPAGEEHLIAGLHIKPLSLGPLGCKPRDLAVLLK